MIETASKPDVITRAEQSRGASDVAIYKMVARTLDARNCGGTLLDVGCGMGNFYPFVRDMCERYIGADVLRYDGYPDGVEFVETDLDSRRVPLPDASVDIATAIEVIEHLENPRAFVRELVRLVKPGGWVIVTTPNQLSLLSLMTLVVKGRFSSFQDGDYPSHISALLEIDLHRIAAEARLSDTSVAYSHSGRIVFTPYHYPRAFARMFPRVLSDNLLIAGRRGHE